MDFLVYCIMGIVHRRKVHEFCKSWSIRKCFLAPFILAGIFIYEIAWIAKVFLQTMAKKVIRKTLYPRMIPDIRYLLYTKLIHNNEHAYLANLTMNIPIMPHLHVPQDLSCDGLNAQLKIHHNSCTIHHYSNIHICFHKFFVYFCK